MHLTKQPSTVHPPPAGGWRARVDEALSLIKDDGEKKTVRERETSSGFEAMLGGRFDTRPRRR